tara:strand:+ start:364 stop:642 length:279 start_codon:yes stop_codon:yes gene_type:complete
MSNSISDKDVAKAKEMLKRSKQDANSISNRDIEKSKKILAISDSEVKGLEKMKRALINDMAKDSVVKKLDESKNLKGKAFANGGKVDFKGSF